MNKVHVVIRSEGGETEIAGIYKHWNAAYEAAKNLEGQEEYDSVVIAVWIVQ
ncbi:hypothetical protein [Enterococcus mundtii]|uniref:hypothetical protein n=1 Tax=Enterococcus mundtii TaxID=53346 RepID=UPI000364A36E|nr:hypothetical protein D931_01809 [Enterococcus faecium 13.SD.W.09]